MKIVNRKVFLDLPSGTIYAKYKPICFEELCIKEESIGDSDWFYRSLTREIESSGSDEYMDLLEIARQNGIELPMVFDVSSRDGCFNEDQLFAVWSKDDVKGLISVLQIAKDV